MIGEDLVQVQETGALPRLTDRERRRAVAAVPSLPPGRYLAVDSGGEVVVIALDQPVTRLGRSLSADVTVEQTSVSRRHALVVERGDTMVLLDDRSRNGTWLNGQRVSGAVLTDGDLITIGDVRIRYVAIPG